MSHDEVKAEGKIESAMKEEGVEVKFFWGSTLYHLDDLPFKVEDLPSNYGAFKDKVEKLEIRKTIAALDQLKSLPSRGDVQLGDIPSLLDLGINPSARTSQVCCALFDSPYYVLAFRKLETLFVLSRRGNRRWLEERQRR